MMMKIYQEITIKPQPEIPLYFLWEKVYQQIHLALAEKQGESGKVVFGISFPEYDAGLFRLGSKLRLFAENHNELEELDINKWLNRLNDYVNVKRIEPMPGEIDGYTCFKRFRLKGSKKKLARRRVKRKGETFEQALAYYYNYEEQRSRLPYINMTSQTNGQRFRLFIERQQKEKEQKGLFSCYGLSNSSTVPLF